MRRLSVLPVAVLSLVLMGCDNPAESAAADAGSPATAVAERVPAAPVAALPVSAPVAATQDAGAQEVPVPPGAGNMGLIPQARGPRPPRTLEAMQARNDRMFARLDANADGAITGDELAALTSGPQGARGGGRMREMLARADADRNARITLEELQAGTARHFARMDADGDGVVTDEERPDRP